MYYLCIITYLSNEYTLYNTLREAICAIVLSSHINAAPFSDINVNFLTLGARVPSIHEIIMKDIIQWSETWSLLPGIRKTMFDLIEVDYLNFNIEHIIFVAFWNIDVKVRAALDVIIPVDFGASFDELFNFHLQYQSSFEYEPFLLIDYFGGADDEFNLYPIIKDVREPIASSYISKREYEEALFSYWNEKVAQLRLALLWDPSEDTLEDIHESFKYILYGAAQKAVETIEKEYAIIYPGYTRKPLPTGEEVLEYFVLATEPTSEAEYKRMYSFLKYGLGFLTQEELEQLRGMVINAIPNQVVSTQFFIDGLLAAMEPLYDNLAKKPTLKQLEIIKQTKELNKMYNNMQTVLEHELDIFKNNVAQYWQAINKELDPSFFLYSGESINSIPNEYQQLIIVYAILQAESEFDKLGMHHLRTYIDIISNLGKIANNIDENTQLLMSLLGQKITATTKKEFKNYYFRWLYMLLTAFPKLTFPLWNYEKNFTDIYPIDDGVSFQGELSIAFANANGLYPSFIDDIIAEKKALFLAQIKNQCEKYASQHELYFSITEYNENKNYYFSKKTTVNKTILFLSKIINFVSGIVMILAWIIIFGCAALSFLKKSKSQTINTFYQKIQNFIENGFGSFFDIKFFIIAVFTFFYFLITFNAFYSLSMNIQALLIFYLLFITSVCIVLPLSLIFLFGCYFIIYVSGFKQENSFFKNYFNDLMSMFSFFIRFVLQSFRIVLIIIFYYLLHEFVNESFIINLTMFDADSSFVAVSVSILRFFFEYFDFLLILFLQAFAYFAVLFWLFSFLFTSKTKIFYEKFFKNKK